MTKKKTQKTQETNPYRILGDIIKQQMIEILNKDLDVISIGSLYSRLGLLRKLNEERLQYEES